LFSQSEFLTGLATAECHKRCDTSSPRALQSHFAKAQIEAAATPPSLPKLATSYIAPEPRAQDVLRFCFVFFLDIIPRTEQQTFLDFVGASDVGAARIFQSVFVYLSLHVRDATAH